MCGIVAIHHPGGGLDQTDLQSALSALQARGPDGSGAWTSPTRRAVLGHTRLAVIGPSNGAQPLADRTGRCHLVANGEFYGYRRIRDDLSEAGHVFRTQSDSEVALHLFSDRGPDALEMLRGEFALVIWDEHAGVLIAARDRFGVKPLYYSQHGGRLLLASEVKALLACGVPPRWDTEAFAAHLQVALPSDRTLFRGIRQVPPGCYLRSGPDGVSVHRYWDLDYPVRSAVSTDPAWDEHVGSLRGALDEAVRQRLVADVPIAFHLSGGLDSSSVVAIAATQLPELDAFTVQFDDPSFDESAAARRTARELGVRLRVVEARRLDFATRLRETVYAGEMVQENSHGVARLLHSRAIRDAGFKVVLGGEGGDELFAGYPHFERDLTVGQSEQARAETRRGYDKVIQSGAPAHLRTMLNALGFIPGWVLERFLTVHLPIGSILRPEFVAELRELDASEPMLAAAEPQLAGRAEVHQSMYLFAKTWLPNYILAAERLDAAQGLESRLPLLDHELFAIARRTPLPRYRYDGSSKFPLRAVMAGRLPSEVVNGRKRPFYAPPVVGDDQMLQEVRALVAGHAFRDNPFFDPDATIRLVDKLSQRPVHRRVAAERVVQLVSSVAALSEGFGLTVGSGLEGVV